MREQNKASQATEPQQCTDVLEDEFLRIGRMNERQRDCRECQGDEEKGLFQIERRSAFKDDHDCEGG